MVGKEILGYRVDEKIGAGGFGTVYKVSKTNASGTYIRALKHITIPTQKQYASVLNSMGGDYAKADDYFASALKDIVNEIRILSTLSESGVGNIVRYYENDIIETPSPKTYDIYIMMEYLTPFSDYVENRNLCVRDVINLGKDILKALISCHEKNIIHRDIKDDNIFVSSDGIYKLGDFGVSKALKDKSRAESVKGTPNFIAPEVYLGKEKYDNTVDLYSLGIVLYKLLNKCRNPFMPEFPAPYSTDDEDAAFEARMTGKIPELPYSAKNRLGEAVLKAIMPRAQRYETATEFLTALELAERNMSNDELSVIVSEVIMRNENKTISQFSATIKASDETIGVGFSVEEEDVVRANDRHLFDTFAAPSGREIAIPKNEEKTEKVEIKEKAESKSEPKPEPKTAPKTEAEPPVAKLNISFTGKMPQTILSDIILSIKSNPAITDRAVADNLKIVAESLKFSKPFGTSKDENVIALEAQMCRIMEALLKDSSSDEEDITAKVSEAAMLLKRKNIIRDTMLKR